MKFVEEECQREEHTEFLSALLGRCSVCSGLCFKGAISLETDFLGFYEVKNSIYYVPYWIIHSKLVAYMVLAELRWSEKATSDCVMVTFS